MRVREGQELGTAAILIASLAVYGATLLSHQQTPVSLSHLPRAIQGAGMMAVELTAARVSEGIYFFPRGTEVAEIAAFAGLSGRRFLSLVPEAPDDCSAMAISAKEEMLTIADLSAVKRMALGLPIDLNRASAEELSLLPGIGETMAAQIVQLRQTRGGFKSLADLTAIPGIKEKKIISLAKHLSISAKR